MSLPVAGEGGGAVLALDATGESCSVAALRADGALFCEVEAMRRGHAERLFPLIEKTLHVADLSIADIAIIAAIRGPGSFTGVRVGVAALRGLALAANVRVVGVDGFSSIAFSAHAAGLRAGRAAVLFGKPPSILQQCFRLEEAGAFALGAAEPLPADTPLTTEIALGPAAKFLSENDCNGAIDRRFEAINIGDLARQTAAEANTLLEQPCAPTPFYLRPPDAEPSQEPHPKRLGARQE